MSPAPIGARAISSAVLGDVVAAALTQAMPKKALARSGPHHLVVTSGTDSRDHSYFVSYETLAGGMGARAYRDGMDGVRVHASGSSNLPVEVLENAYPMRVEKYELWQDSAGGGKYRGGMGVLRDYCMLGDNMVISLSSERQHAAAAGMEGGEPGKCGAFILNPESSEPRQLPSAAGEIPIERGSVLRICTPAGGGYGPTSDRDRDAIAKDVLEERVSSEAAKRVYGWEEKA
jgi:N-methylhydantoinase B